MAHPFHHAESSARKWGGKPEDYLEIHNWFDQTKAHIPDARHRLVLHNSFGIFLCEQLFGTTILNSDGKQVPVRIIAEQHVKEDFGGFIPTLTDCFADTPVKGWMYQQAKPLSRTSATRVKKQDEPQD
jgi:hypothetical protein